MNKFDPDTILHMYTTQRDCLTTGQHQSGQTNGTIANSSGYQLNVTIGKALLDYVMPLPVQLSINYVGFEVIGVTCFRINLNIHSPIIKWQSGLKLSPQHTHPGQLLQQLSRSKPLIWGQNLASLLFRNNCPEVASIMLAGWWYSFATFSADCQ